MLLVPEQLKQSAEHFLHSLSIAMYYAGHSVIHLKSDKNKILQKIKEI